MSEGKGTFSTEQIEELRNQFRGMVPMPTYPRPIPVELPSVAQRMFPLDRLGLIVGIGASVVGAFFGARYLLSESISDPIELKHSDDFPTTELGSITEASGIGGNQSEPLRKNIKVTLHQCPRGYNTPCISPFSLKIETFLRVAKIPYEVSCTAQPQTKNSPWLTVGDTDITDADECITFLCDTFGINLEQEAKASRLTASRLVGIQLDNHIYWGIALWRWVYDKGASLKDIQPLSPQALNVISSVSETVRQAAWYHGLGRLPYKKVLEIIKTDLADLSAALGAHPYFMGDRPGEVDCNAFAMLAQIFWNMPSSPFEKELLKYDNLLQFVHRVRDNYWPDWKEVLHKPGDNEVPENFYYPTSEFNLSMSGPQNVEESKDTCTSGEAAEVSGQLGPSNRARSMPLKPNDSKVLQQKSSNNKVPSAPIPPKPKDASRVTPSPGTRVGNTPQQGYQKTQKTPIPQQLETNETVTISQAEFKSIQATLSHLNKKFGLTHNSTQNQQNAYNNNSAYNPQHPIPRQGVNPHGHAFYPPGMVPLLPGQQFQSGYPVYYPNIPPPTSGYPSNGFYPDPDQPM